MSKHSIKGQRKPCSPSADEGAFRTASASDLTGLMPAKPENADEWDSYAEAYGPFTGQRNRREGE